MQLVQELVGAQAAAKMLEETWAALRPELKEQLANAMAERLLVDIAEGSGHVGWTLDVVLKSAVAKLADPDDELAKRLAKAVRDRVEARFDKLVEDVAKSALSEAVSLVNDHYEKIMRHKVWP